jgi:hypothetical protein
MKRIGFIAFFLLFISASAFAWPSWQRSGTLTGGEVTDNTTLTITLPNNVGEHSYLYVPTIDNATLALSGSMDGTIFGTIYDEQTNGAAKIAWSVGATTGGLMLELPPIQVFKKIKITCGAEQSSDRIFVIFGK